MLGLEGAHRLPSSSDARGVSVWSATLSHWSCGLVLVSLVLSLVRRRVLALLGLVRLWVAELPGSPASAASNTLLIFSC